MARTEAQITESEALLLGELDTISNERYAYKNSSGNWVGAEITGLSGYTITNDTEIRTLDCDSTNINELADVLGTLIGDISIIGATTGLDWGDTVDGTTGDGIILNSTAAQATAETVGISWNKSNLFNTNSGFNSFFGKIINSDNAGAGYNTGLYINNLSTKFTTGAVSVTGSAIHLRQTGVNGTALSVYGEQNVNAATGGLINYTLDDTQSGSSIVQKIDLGSSATTQTGLLIEQDGENLFRAFSIGGTGYYGLQLGGTTTGLLVNHYVGTDASTTTGYLMDIANSQPGGKSGLEMTLRNTQTNPFIMQKISMGTSAIANVGLDISGSTSAKVMNIATNLTQDGGTATGTTTKEIKIQINGVDYVIEAKSEA